MELVLINERDNVRVSLENGQKYAAAPIKKGEAVVKYGFPIGIATEEIPAGAHVHTHNLKTALAGTGGYTYAPSLSFPAPVPPAEILAYERPNGEIGIRNDIWIVPAVGCVNGAARQIAEKTGALAFLHPYGCSQLGGDLARTQAILRGLITHPNAGGVLVLGLGCENNRLSDLMQGIDCSGGRIRFFNAQDVDDEVAHGIGEVRALQALSAKDARVPVPVSKLKIGLKCGGSDGLSGITANPLVGRVADRLVAMGGAAALTEIPEAFGAEALLLNRAVSETVFRQAAALIDEWKSWYLSHGEKVSENPSPGNKDGGITTLEEKSLGCVQKGGTSPLVSVLGQGEKLRKPGLSLVSGPGNDMVAVTNLTAAGCHLILFTTGRGTPLGAPVPTVKISTNTPLYKKKPGWIDYDAFAGDADGLFKQLLDVANGRPTKNEERGEREISIFKDGVIL
ncbi:MAG: altronate dehydratase [Clostridia bacterium]|nr:altronate dehydratase [Clostridia bacterium]